MLQDDKGALWWVEDPGTDAFQYVNIDSTEGLLAENTTNDGTIAAFGIGGAALAGLGAMFAGSSGGGGGNAAVGDGNTGGGDNGGGNNGGGNNGGGNNGGGNNGGGDTTAPGTATNLTLTDNVGAIQGAIVNGVTTDDNTPTLTGTAEAGATVSIYDGNTLLGTVVVGADGNWSFTSPALAEGQHSFTTTVTDAAGNTSGSSDPITFIVDTVAPVAAAGLVVSDDVGGTQGALTAGSTTDDNTPTISGTAEPGTYVSVYDGTTLLGTATVGADGTWSFTTPALSNGAHSLTVTVTDAAGNVSAATDPFNFSVTADLPPATTTLEITDDTGSTLVQLSNGSYTHDNTPVLSGLASAGSVITLYDGDTLLGSVVAGENGQWVFTPAALADGSHAFHATIVDTTGNTSESATITVTIDTVVPDAAGDLQLSNNDDSTIVPISAGGSTNDNTPTLSGTAEPGSVVTVRDGDTVLGTVTVGSNGSWTFTSPTLTDGDHSLTTTVTDPAGNVSASSDPIAFTVDTSIPAAASGLTVTDNVGESTGALTSGATTDDSTPTLAGQAEPGTTVSVYDGTTLLGTATVGANGSWSFTTSALSNGAHSLTVTVTDAAGNVSQPTAAFNLTVDADLPPATSLLEVTDDTGSTLVLLANGAYTHDNTPTLSGLAGPNDTITLYSNGEVIGTAIADASGQWEFDTTTLADGTYDFRAVATNAAGETSESDTISIIIDTAVPVAVDDLQLTNDEGNTPVAVSAGSATNDTTPVLSGTAEPGSTVTISDGSTVLGTATVGQDGSWSFTTPTLTDGSHSLTTTVTDPAGNIGPASNPFTFTVDTQPPAAAGDVQLSNNTGSTAVPIVSGGITNGTTPVLSGTAEPGSTVTISDGTNVLGSVTVGANGSWSFTSPALDDGQHSLTTVVTDPAGNTGPASTPIIFEVDTAAPAAVGDLVVTDNVGDLQGQLASNDFTDDNTPTLSGTAEVGAVIKVYDGTVLLGSTSAGQDGSWSFTTSALNNGEHTLSVTVTDAAGNVSTATEGFVLTVAADLPPTSATLQITDDSGNTLVQLANGASTHDTSPILSGQAQAGDVIALYDGGNLLGTLTVGASGQWSFPTTGLTEGAHTFYASITDVTGNSSNSPSITITVDITTPDAATGVQLSNDAGSSPVPIASGGLTNDSSPLLTGAGEPGATVSVYDGTTLLGTATVGNNGSWSFSTPALGEGNHSLTTTVTDAAGNVSPASDAITFTVDTVAPAAATDLTVADNVGASTGDLTSGATTDDNTLELSGQAEANSVVRVYDGTVLLGTVTADTDGAWSFTTTALTNGSHSLTVTVTDTAGNLSPATTPFIVNVQADLPPATLTLEVTDDSGSTLVQLATGANTQDTTPVLSGLAIAGAVVTLTDNGTVLGTVVAGANGQWTYTPAVLPDGAHAFQSSYTDATGNPIDSAVITITIDTLAPAPATGVEISNGAGETIPPGGATNDSSPVLNGSAEPGSTVTISDGTTVLGTTTAGQNGDWSYTTPPLTDGTHNITTTVTDPAGNTSPASDPIAVVVDTQPPAAPGNVQLSNNETGTPVPITNGATNDTTPVLSGTAEPGSTVTVSDNGTPLGTATVGADGSWSYTPSLGEGDHSLTATVTDPAGNSSSPSTAIPVTVDTTAPTAPGGLQLSNDQSGTPVPVTTGTTNDTTPVLSGTAEPGSTVTVSDGDTVLGSVSVGTDGNWSYTTPALSEGDHSLTATVTDPAGNISPVSDPVVISIDVTPPPVATGVIVSNEAGTQINTGGATNDTTPVISGSATPGSTVVVSDGTDVLGTATVNDDGSWSFTPDPALGEGQHSLSTTVVDPAGNSSTASTPIIVTIDTEAPNEAGSLVLSNNNSGTPVEITNGTTNDATPVLSGTAEPGSTVTVTDNTDTVLGTATVDALGNWTFTPANPLDPGSHSLTTTVTDAAGNVGPQSDPIVFTVNLTPPVVGTVVLNNDSTTPATEINNGGATNDTTPVLSGSAAEGSIITVYDGNTLLGTVQVGASGSWSYTTTALSQGNHSLSATVTDPAGNVSDRSTPIGFVVDTVPPAAATELQLVNGQDTTIATGGFTNDTTPVLSGTAEPGSTVTVTDSVSGVLGTATVGIDGSWSFTPDAALAAGPHTLTATVTDPAGNVSSASSPITFTIDVSTPDAASGVQLSNNEGSIPVAIVNGGATNDTTPVLSGSAEAGSVVTVTDTVGAVATVLGSVTVGANGNWSFTSPALGTGEHSLTTTVTDPAGNISDASDPFVVTIDTTPPAAVGEVELANDAGTAITGGFTNDSTPTLSGTGDVGSVITVRDGTTVLGSVAVNDEGEWTFTTPVLSESSHSLTATATDAAGNSSGASTPIVFIVDTTPPAAATGVIISNDSSGSLVTITNGITSDNTPVLSGSAEPGSTVTISTASGELGTAVVGENGAWSFTPSPALADGAYTLTTTVTDAAGNTGPASTPVNITVLATPPADATNLQLTNNEGSSPVVIVDNGSTNDTTPVLSGTATGGSYVTIFVDGAPLGTAVVGSNGNWSFTVPELTETTHTLTTVVTDAAGNVSGETDALTVTIDLTQPDPITDISIANDAGVELTGPTNDTTPLLSGNAEPGSLVTIYDGTTPIASVVADTTSGDWSYNFTDMPLSAGDHTLSATATDAAGNVSDAGSSVVVSIDLTPAAASNLIVTNDNGTPVVVGNNGFTNDTTPVLSGTAEPGSSVAIYDGQTLLTTVQADPDSGAWSYTADFDSGTTHALSVVVTDAAGNVGPASAVVNITISTDIPAAVTDLTVSNNEGNTLVTIQDGGSTNDVTPELTGTSSIPNSIITIYDGLNNPIGSTTAGADGKWSFTTDALPPGEHSLSVTVTDAAGNTSPASDAVTFLVDITAPDAVTDVVVLNDSSAPAVEIPTGTPTNDTTPLLQGNAANAEDGSIVTIYEGNVVLGTATVTNGAWSFNTPVLGSGSHTLTVTVTDPAGNVSTNNPSIAVVIDTQAPDAATGVTLTNDLDVDNPVTIPNGGLTNDNTPVLTGSVGADSTVSVSINGGAPQPATLNGDGTWTFTPSELPDGSYTFSVVVTDAAGNVSPAVNTMVEIDATPPVEATGVTVTNDNGTAQVTTDGITYTSDNTPVIAGTATAGTIVNIYNNGELIGTTTVGTNGQWSFTPTTALPENVNSITVRVEDAAGNLSDPTDPIVFTVDTAAPTAATVVITDNDGTPVTVTNGFTNDTTPLLSGTGSEAGNIISIYDTDQQLLGTATVQGDLSWSFQLPTLSATAHTLTITVTDEIGNSTSTTVALTVDTTAPEPVSAVVIQSDTVPAEPVTVANGGSTNDTTPTISGSAEPGSTVILTNTLTGLVFGTANADPTTGAWTFTPTTALTNGTTYSLSITATDAAGNVSVGSNVSFTIDTVAPTLGAYTVSNNEGATPVTISQGGLTNDDTPVLRGTGEVGAIITITDTVGGTTVTLGTAIVADNGQWRFVTDTLGQGAHSLTVTATDAAGNATTSPTTFGFTVDSVAPAAPLGVEATANSGDNPGNLTSGGTTDDNTITFGGTAEAGSVVSVYDGTTLLGTTTASLTDGAWTFTTPVLSNGDHSFTATATDAAGNVSAAAPTDPFTQTVDAPVPVTTSTLLITDDSGSTPVTLVDGDFTKDVTPVLSGLSVPLVLVTILDNGTAIASVLADATGQWNYTPTLGQGEHEITITVGGLEVAGPVGITVDNVAPALVTGLVVNNNSSGTNVPVTSGSTNDNTPALTGNAEANSIVTIYDNNVLIGSTTATAGGTWSFITPTLTSGSHSFTATSTDLAGNVSAASTPVAVTVDTIAPAAATLVVTNDLADPDVVVANGGRTNDTTPVLSGTAETGAVIRIYQNGTEVGSTVATGGTWSYNVATLAEGTYAFTVRATDAAGNVSVASSTATVTIDTTAPTGLTVNASNNNGSSPVAIANNGTTNDSTPALSGTAEAGSVVKISDNGLVIGSVTAAANGSWSFVTGTLGDGQHTLSVTATDVAGNIGAASTVIINVVTAAPTAPTLIVNNDANNTLTPVGNNGSTNDSTPTLTGTATAGNVITIYDGTTVIGSTTAVAGNTWSFTPTTALSNGSHTFTVKATDTLGNATAQVGTTTVTIDTVAPVASTLVIANDNGTAPVTVVNGGSTNDSTPLLSGVAGVAEAGGIVRVYDNISGSLVLVGSGVVQPDGTWSFNSSTLATGTHPLSVTVTDAAGNISGSTSASVIIDTTAPTVQLTNTANNNGSAPVTIANNGTTNDSTPALSGTAEAGSVVVVRDGQTVVGSVVAAANGTWSITTSTLGEGAHTLTVTATDAAGNVGTATNTITFTVSTAATAAPTLIVNNDANSTLTPVANNGATNDSTPTLTGTAAAGNVITIYDGTTVLGSTTAIAGGTWSFTSPTLSNGSHALSVTATNAAGTVSSPVASTVIIDTVAPVASTLVIANDNGSTPVTVANGGSTNDTTPLLSGVVSVAEAGGVVRIYDSISGTQALVGTAIVQANGSWSFSSTLAAGTHPLSVTVTDAAGNISGTTTASVTIDTTAPAVQLTNTINNNGSTPVTIANNGSTNDNTPALSGTAEAGSVVTIRDGQTVVGSVVAAANGTWSITTSTLGEGAHTLTVTATDAAGNVGTATNTITFTVSTAATAAPTLIVNNDANNTLTPVANNGATNDSTPTLTGTAVAGNVITIYDGTTVLGSTTAIAGGTWSFTSPTLSNGSHALSVTATNAAGTVSSPVASTVIIDTVAPVASTLVIANDNGSTPVTVASGGSTNDTTPLLSGVVSTAEAGSRVTIYDNISGSQVLLGTAIVQANGSWSYSSTLAVGTHPLSVTVTDAAGNVSGTTSASVTIDTTAPAVQLVTAANNNGSTPVTIANNGSTNDNTPALSGTAEAGSVVTIRDGQTTLGSVVTAANGTWSFTSGTLTDGSHTISVTATDAAGNVGTATNTITFNIDTGVPATVTNLTVSDNVGATQGTLANGAVTDDNTPTLQGTAEVNAIITIYDGTTVLGSTTANATTGAWTFTTAALTDGTHPLSVTVKDAAGNISPNSATVSITIDTVAPVASTLVITNDVTSVVVPNGGSTNDTTPTLSGTVSAAEVGSRVSIYDNITGTQVLLGTAIVQANGSWSFTTVALLQGTHPISVTVTDPAGNISGTTSATVIIDTTPPAALTIAASNNNGSSAVAIPNNGTTNDSTPLLSGTGEAGAKVTVYDGTTLLGTTTVGSNGQWTFTTPTLTNATHTLNATQTDAAGNVSPNASVTLTVDTVAPTVTTLVITNDSVAPTGTVANGGSTRDTTPVLSGVAERGGIVTIYDGATLLGSVVANATTGAWSFTTATLVNGSHPISVTVTDTAGNVSTPATATVIIDTVAPTAATGLAINDAGTILTGTGEAGTTVTVRDSGGASIGTATVAANGSFSVSLTTAQTTGGTLSVSLTDAAGNVSATANTVGAIVVRAANDEIRLNYADTDVLTPHNSATVQASSLLTVGLGTVLDLSVLGSNPYLSFNLGTGESRTVTITGSQSGVSLLSTVYLEVYKLVDGTTSTYTRVSESVLFSTLVALLATNSGSKAVTLSGSGTYIVFMAATGVGVLTTNKLVTSNDISTVELSVASTVTGNLLTNDTSSVAGTVPVGTALTLISGTSVNASANTVINTAYGTLTVDSHGAYTYTLKAGINIATLPSSETFSYTVTDSHGVATTATLTVDLTHGALLAANSLLAASVADTSDVDASGSIYGDSTTTHTGTLSITNEHGDTTTVSSSGSTLVTGDYGTLSIAANGSYTYTLKAGLDAQTITHKEVFSYSLAASDGTITHNSFTIDLHPTITGTAGADTLTGSAYDDTITTGAGADTLVYHLLATADSTGGNGHDTWTDFNVAQGDKVDISNLLIGWNDSTSNINDFVKVDHTSDGNTVLSIDRDGTGTAYSSTQLVTLEGVNVSLEELLQQPHQNTTA
ncbi:Ig-like domain-containing protein [Pantoea rwandensis]|nr:MULTISPECIES: Ig-like domain-containing protein [unclassified Pantoea]MCA1178232.1 Ig-like domain-containing protein [Pantoea sp. alder69]MCA1251916.1 Ig-like domain-containing protein [Pantoea sp. alder70]MCA1266672.1 Ig-like domain-containing protein [Pantoea sp. alder81]